MSNLNTLSFEDIRKVDQDFSEICFDELIKIFEFTTLNDIKAINPEELNARVEEKLKNKDTKLQLLSVLKHFKSQCLDPYKGLHEKLLKSIKIVLKRQRNDDESVQKEEEQVAKIAKIDVMSDIRSRIITIQNFYRKVGNDEQFKHKNEYETEIIDQETKLLNDMENLIHDPLTPDDDVQKFKNFKKGILEYLLYGSYEFHHFKRYSEFIDALTAIFRNIDMKKYVHFKLQEAKVLQKDHNIEDAEAILLNLLADNDIDEKKLINEKLETLEEEKQNFLLQIEDLKNAVQSHECKEINDPTNQKDSPYLLQRWRYYVKWFILCMSKKDEKIGRCPISLQNINKEMGKPNSLFIMVDKECEKKPNIYMIPDQDHENEEYKEALDKLVFSPSSNQRISRKFVIKNEGETFEEEKN